MTNRGVDIDFRIHAGVFIVGMIVLVFAAKRYIRDHIQPTIGHPQF